MANWTEDELRQMNAIWRALQSIATHKGEQDKAISALQNETRHIQTQVNTEKEVVTAESIRQVKVYGFRSGEGMDGLMAAYATGSHEGLLDRTIAADADGVMSQTVPNPDDISTWPDRVPLMDSETGLMADFLVFEEQET
jgi:hypothetical protein